VPFGLTLLQVLDNLRAQGIKLRDTASFHLPGHVRLGVLPLPAHAALKTAWHLLLKVPR
jgi:histidinol-phosphate aminotransferase